MATDFCPCDHLTLGVHSGLYLFRILGGLSASSGHLPVHPHTVAPHSSPRSPRPQRTTYVWLASLSAATSAATLSCCLVMRSIRSRQARSSALGVEARVGVSCLGGPACGLPLPRASVPPPPAAGAWPGWAGPTRDPSLSSFPVGFSHTVKTLCRVSAVCFLKTLRRPLCDLRECK